MEIGNRVKTELNSRLNIGGVWYAPGSVVELDEADVQVYESRGFSKPARPGSKAVNVIPAREMPLVTRSAPPAEAPAPSAPPAESSAENTAPADVSTIEASSNGPVSKHRKGR
jgi:hypothetical protein